MLENKNEILRSFDRADKELSDLYHEIALKMGIPDSFFSVFYVLYNLGNGCLQKDICQETFLNKQTVNSAIRKMTLQGYLSLRPGHGREMHLFLTDKGAAFAQQHIAPVVQKEHTAFSALKPEEQAELLRLLKIYVTALKTQLRSL